MSSPHLKSAAWQPAPASCNGNHSGLHSSNSSILMLNLSLSFTYFTRHLWSALGFLFHSFLFSVCLFVCFVRILSCFFILCFLLFCLFVSSFISCWSLARLFVSYFYLFLFVCFLVSFFLSGLFLFCQFISFLSFYPPLGSFSLSFIFLYFRHTSAEFVWRLFSYCLFEQSNSLLLYCISITVDGLKIW